jgi:hypothetical protein
MSTDAVKGGCLCGGVTFEIRPPVDAFRYCYCSRCRKASGSAHAANMFVRAEQFAWISGEALITRYKLPSAQRFAVWFCRECGSRVPSKVPDSEHYLVPAGVLDGDPAARPDKSIFWDSRAAWYVEPAAIPKLGER